MSLDNTVTETTNYGTKLTVVGGKWTLRCEKGTPGSIERALTKGDNIGDMVSELQYGSLSGHVANGRIVDGNFGKSADIDLIDYKTNDKYTVNMSLDSRYLFDFIKRLPSIDTSREVRLELVPHKTKRTKKGNPVYNLHTVQDDRMVPDYYIEWKKNPSGKATRTLLHGLPDAVEGIKGWDFSEQEEFLLQKFSEFFSGYSTPVSDIPDSVPDSVTDQSEKFIPEDDEDSDPIPF